MTERFSQLLGRLAAPAGGGFHVLQLPDPAGYYAGRDCEGGATLLIRATGAGRTVPLVLAGLAASFDVPCRIQEPGGAERVERLTSVTCRSSEPAIEAYFAGVVEIMIPMLGPLPSADAVSDALSHLADLFQKLRSPPRRSVIGLVGELMVIRAARDPVGAVWAWRADPDERFDFAAGSLRLEAKASGMRARLHSLSLEQANPAPGSVGYLASVLVEQMAGGTSLSDLIDAISARLTMPRATMRLQTIVADTLGQDLAVAMNWSFDLTLASTSLLYYDMREVPALRGNPPPGVSGVRFTSDLTATQPLAAIDYETLEPNARIMLPALRSIQDA
ncbi:hypothetical protein JHFBIEKO_2209 [Methylobacterium mesophilicum]|uniref:PD-(D/E)XK motif protein n=1 Tax=Methylobacterium mesophilicum TaxID=39956 RepID=UPI001EE21672|nr:PD-(D/E)XK motif protein [Methylobacterium mesophilicum]GJE21761.1 hypothetical protein JHFBIEKO_2209 [Methylobacterium mesophilicum]